MAQPARTLPALPTQPAGKRDTPATAPTALWLCGYLPELALEAVGIDIARAVQTRAAVWMDRRGAATILAATPPALASGVRPGQTRGAALAICGDLQLYSRDERREKEILGSLAELALGYSAWVSLDHPDAVVLEIGASLKLFGGAKALIGEARGHFAAAGHTLRWAAAPGAAPAWLLARAGRELQIDDRAALRSGLGDLPIHHLPLSETLLSRVGKTGTRTLRDLWRLPRDGLLRRYGAELLVWLDAAAGQEPRPPRLFRPPLRFHAHRWLAQETEHLPWLQSPAIALLEELRAFLIRHDAVTDHIELDLHHHRQAPTPCHLKLRQASRDPDRLMTLLHERLERIALPAPVVALSLSCGDIQAYRATCRDLFELPPAPGATDWDTLLELLEQHLGLGKAQFLTAHADVRPEYAFGIGQRPGGEQHPRRHRPLWLLHPPQPCLLRAFRLLAGHERIEAGWWAGGDIRRDYRVGVDSDGVQVWLFKELDGSKRSYAQGLFG